MKIMHKNNRKYKIIPEARKVICETQDYWLDREWQSIKKPVREVMVAAANARGINMGESYYTTAYCDERDEFDEKKGMDVASEKADYQRHLYNMQYYARMSRLLQEAIVECDNLWVKHADKAQTIFDDMVDTYGWGKE